jgi:hypothetical protein
LLRIRRCYRTFERKETLMLLIDAVANLHDVDHTLTVARVYAHHTTESLEGSRKTRCEELVGKIEDTLAHCQRLLLMCEADLHSENHAQVYL